jgi:hypothetical protein
MKSSIAFGILLYATAAGAQTTTTTTATADDAAAQVQAGTTMHTSTVAKPYWAPLGGFEGDTHGSGYGFFGPSYVHPITDNFAITGQIFGNYLYYQYPNFNGVGVTKVQSPGASAEAGVRFGGRNWVQFSAGPSFKSQHISRQLADGTVATSNVTKVGLSLGGDVYVNPTSHSNMMGIVSYGAEDKYTWSMVNFKQQISNWNDSGSMTHFAGVEFIAQGNKDITSRQFGGFVEFLHVPSSASIDFRAGYKTSTFAFGPKETGPYFAVGFYQRLK